MGRQIKKSNDVWKTVQGRGMTVTPREVEQFRFDHCDYLIAESMLSGCQTPAAIAANLDMKPEEIRDRLLYPVRCAWLSRELEKGVQTRLGMVMSAVFNRAVTTGDVSAAKFLHQKYNQYREPSQEHKHLHLVNLTNLNDAQLDKLIADQKRKLNLEETEDK